MSMSRDEKPGLGEIAYSDLEYLTGSEISTDKDSSYSARGSIDYASGAYETSSSNRGSNGSANVGRITDSAIGVGQAEFAYLDDELKDQLGVEALETGGIDSCYGVGILDSDTGNMGLIHADKEYLKQIRQGINQITRELEGEFDQARLVTNNSEDKRFERVVNYLEQHFDEVNVEASYSTGSKSLGVDQDGFYEPENPTIPETSELDRLEIMNREGLKDGTEEAIEHWYQDQWSKYETNHLPEELKDKWVRKENGGKKYAKRVHRPITHRDKADYTVRFEIPSFQSLKGIEIDADHRLRKIKGDTRLNIRSRHPIEDDKEKVEEINQEAARVWDEIQSA